ncbi:MAG TPA: DNA replication protein DnaC [Lachnospiraceae bacterium]|jgi:DNA replication protein DnaC|nr:DNA replication protein DnaC [Lachnospiraceae bacterium]
MGLSKEQYDRIMMRYSQTRDQHMHELAERKKEIYARIPEYRELEDCVPRLGMESLKASLAEGAKDQEGSNRALRMELNQIAKRKKQLLVTCGYPADYLEMQYTCPDCRDTGYIDGKKCHCLVQKEIDVLYDQSHLKRLFPKNNFSLLRYDYYKGEDLQNFQRAVSAAKAFLANFGKNSDYENLYFYGTVGTGKSFLSVCIAREVLEMNHSVLYFSSEELFSSISTLAFNYQQRETYDAFRRDLYGCDLLIIDDLGTESTNSFVSSQFFTLINERHNNGKSTIISTNLSLRDLQDRYSDRVLSRITTNYVVLKFSGQDIRFQQRFSRSEHS